MIRLQREKRQQREAEDEEKRKKLLAEGTDAAKAELDRMERTKKLNVGNICTDKYVSTHQKSNASESANPTTKKDTKLQVAASNQETFVEGYEEFLQEHRPLLLEYAAIDEQDEVSEQFTGAGRGHPRRVVVLGEEARVSVDVHLEPHLGGFGVQGPRLTAEEHL